MELDFTDTVYEKCSPLKDGRSIVDILRCRAEVQPDSPAITYLADGTGATVTLTYSGLDRRARAISAVLQERVNPGEPVMVLCRPGLGYVAAFLGCLYSGAVAVPAYPPGKRRGGSALRLLGDDVRARLAISDAPTGSGWDDLALESIDESKVDDAYANSWREHHVSPEDLAFLQYTSGSTSRPRGVEITHANIIANQEMVRRAFRQTSDSVILSWLPLHHDMGLCAGVFQPLYLGAHCYLMPPTGFLRRPANWLNAISAYNVTTSGGPNFAFEMCVRRIPEIERADLNLSKWTVAFNGSEPVRPETLERFAASFAPCGFRMEAFHPCYGLAEATLLVAGRQTDSPLRIDGFHADGIGLRGGDREPGARRLTGCGQPATGLLIVDPGTHLPLGPGETGEIWVSGPSVGRGYWHRDTETRHTFQARLSNGEDRTFLRTGDLGFIVDGELFVTGRIKEMLIFGGRNYYPHDIESAVVEALEPWGVTECAVVGLESEGGERLEVILEQPKAVDSSTHEVWISKVRAAVALGFGLSAHAVLVVKRGTIPKTTSGKTQRSECKARLLAGTWNAIAERTWEVDVSGGNAVIEEDGEIPEGGASIESEIRAFLARLLRVSAGELDPTQPIVASGLDSLGAAGLAQFLESRWGLCVQPADVLDTVSIADLAAEAARVVTPTKPSLPLLPPDCTELSAEQARLWLVQQVAVTASALNLQGGFRVRGSLDWKALQSALEGVVGQHDSLRTTFAMLNGRPARRIAPRVEVTLRTIRVDVNEFDTAVETALYDEWRHPFDLERGPLWRVLGIACDDGEGALIITAHHLISDAWSFRVFIEGLFEIYGSVTGTRLRTAREVPEPYSRFVAYQQQVLSSDELRKDIAYWSEALRDVPVAPAAKRGSVMPRPACRSVFIPSSLEAAIRECCREYGLTLFTVLLAALKAQLAASSGASDITVACPVAGRCRPEFDRTIGLFGYPLLLRTDLTGNRTFTELLDRVGKTVHAGLARQRVPFSRVLACTHRNAGSSFSMMFSYLVEPDPPTVPGAVLTPLDIPLGTLDTGHYLSVVRSCGRLKASICYDAEAYQAGEMDEFLSLYLEILRSGTEAPGAERAWFVGPARPLALPPKGRKLVVAASFSAEPLREPLEFWVSEMDLPFELEVVPSDQVLQQLLDPAGSLKRNDDGINLLMFRPEDLESRASEEASAVFDEFLKAVQAFGASSPAPLLLVLCPPADASMRAAQSKGRDEWRRRLESAIAELGFVELLDGMSAASAYDVPNVGDPYLDRTARIPYTPEFLAALATAAIRRICAIEGRLQYKAVVVDCDHTLWNGVCGEDGPLGVRVESSHHALQELLVQQRALGRHICVCSKNDPADVAAVFDQNPDMLLRSGDVLSWRVNWNPKSENLLSIADELNLGLDSFLFFDDDPIECAEVRARLPEVLVIELPKTATKLERVLRHVWPFDSFRVTATARDRVRLQQEHATRNRLLAESADFAAFLAKLELQVAVHPFEPSDLARVAELVARTNQFNLSGIRRSEAQLAKVLDGYLECATVLVSDRFGDYGLAGAALYQVEGEALVVDTLVLSCRALGRGVEHQIAAELARIARSRGREWVEFHCRPLPRNIPARQFVSSLEAESDRESDDGHVVRCRASVLELLQYEPGQTVEAPTHKGGAPGPPSTGGGGDMASKLARIALKLSSAEAIVGAYRAREARPWMGQACIRPRTGDEQRVAAIVADLLGVPLVGVTDSFFDLGGHSVLAVQLVSRIFAEFGVEIPLRSLFSESPTVERLVQLIDVARFKDVDPERLTALLAELEEISDAEARELLTDQENI